MFRDGRWFWWLVAACLGVLVADISAVGPFADAERRPTVEVLGDSVERTPSTSTSTSTSTTSTTAVATTAVSATVVDGAGLEGLEGFTPEDLEAIEDLVEESGG